MTIPLDEDNPFELESVASTAGAPPEPPPPLTFDWHDWEAEKATFKETILALLSNHDIVDVESRVDSFLDSLEVPLGSEPAEELEAPLVEAPPLVEEPAVPSQPHPAGVPPGQVSPSGVAGSTHAMVYKVQ